jgi:hypothetical protein
MWRGGRVSPLGANLVVVLYRKVDPDSSLSEESDEPWDTLDWDAEQYAGAGSTASELRAAAIAGAAKRRRMRARQHLVRLVYNEQVVPVPGCGDGEQADCSIEEFLEVMGPRADGAALSRLCAVEGGGLAWGAQLGAPHAMASADGLPLQLDPWWQADDTGAGSSLGSSAATGGPGAAAA